MPLRAIAAVVIGLVHLLLWLSIGPSAVADPGGWGPCPPRSMFPIDAPFPPDTYGFDLYVCEIQPRLILEAALVMIIAFGVSGALTHRLAKSSHLLVGIIPTVLLLLYWFFVQWRTDQILPFETAVSGSLIVSLSLSSALIGAAISRAMARRNTIWNRGG
jgi:hypothetical protein